MSFHHGVALVVKLTGWTGLASKTWVTPWRLISTCVLAVLVSLSSVAADQPAKPATVDDVVVLRLDLKMPADDPAKDDALDQSPREKFLWSHFFNRKDEPSLTHVTTKEWRSMAEQLHAALVSKARKLNLPAEALDKALHTVADSEANDGLAVIPVGAYLIRDGGRDAWAIVCNWEYSGPVVVKSTPLPSPFGGKPLLKPEFEWLCLGHRRVFVFSVTDNEWLAFTTCG